jgi:hypothetical protein
VGGHQDPAPGFRERNSRETVVCRKCGEAKRCDEFKPNPRKRNGLSSYCRDCHNAATRSWREEQRALVREALEARRRREREALGRDVEVAAFDQAGVLRDAIASVRSAPGRPGTSPVVCRGRTARCCKSVLPSVATPMRCGVRGRSGARRRRGVDRIEGRRETTLTDERKRRFDALRRLGQSWGMTACQVRHDL